MKVVTPSDTTDLQLNGTTLPCRALFFTAAGNISFDTAGGTTVTLAIPATATGQVSYIRAKRIRATGTTIAAGNIFACY
jgi:hypothetical protein